MTLRASHLVHAVIRNDERYRRSICLPNYTPAGWFECDVFELTKPGYLREYEVKISRSDFFRDSKKERNRHVAFGSPPIVENKIQMIEQRDPRCPVQFWYVCPKDLIEPSEVPEWAGLIHCEHRGGSWPLSSQFVRTVKAAPRLHDKKADEKIRSHALRICYWRMHGLLAGGPKEAVAVEGVAA